MMPGMDGIQLLRQALEIDPNLVGIIMTGQGTIPTAVEAMKVGAFDYLLKPFNLQTDAAHPRPGAWRCAGCAWRTSGCGSTSSGWRSSRRATAWSAPARPCSKVVQLIEKVAPTDATVLVRGAERHRQGAGRPGPALQQPARATSRW